ncbi:hypothetical protein R1sor_010384 [Riccia sorocarpa]|uniref:Uncharacterized protein n=1 Tax=Riccia sorocarpa TaxID=122646 RepID=A0ABD3HY53_9MARC
MEVALVGLQSLFLQFLSRRRFLVVHAGLHLLAALGLSLGTGVLLVLPCFETYLLRRLSMARARVLRPPPDYLVPDNTPVEDADDEPITDLSFPITQTPKIQPLSALTEVEMDKDEKNRVRRDAITRCLVDQSVLRIPIEQFHVPSSDSNWEKWGPYQIRACSKSFVNELKKHMQTNAYAHYHNFILLVDPRDRPSKLKWVFPPPSSWKFYVIGGNHSALARMELLAQYPGIYKHFRHCNCIIYAGLTKSEAALFAHDDNFDAEVRHKYTYHQRVEYFHRQFMEAKQTGESMASLRKRLALETMNISEEDSKAALNTLEGTFQVAFRTGKLWDVQESIFCKFERKELKSMKAAGKGKKKDDDSGELALEQISSECDWCRMLDVIMKAFCHLSGCKDWEEVQDKCGPYASDERLYSFEKSFKLMLKDRSNLNAINKALFGVSDDKPDSGKRKRASRVKSLAQVLPTEFLDHIDSANEYKEAKEQGRDAPQPIQTFKTWAKEGSLKSVEWDVFHHDVHRMQISEVTRGHKHSAEVAPSSNNGRAEMNKMIVETEDDDAILLHNDDGAGSVGTMEDDPAEDNEDDPEDDPEDLLASSANPAEDEDFGVPERVIDSLPVEGTTAEE